MSSVQFLKNLWKVGGVTKNSSGAIDAQVSLRRDTLANLLAIVDAGDGEIAVATDFDALVEYQGDPSTTKVYRQSRRLEYARFGTSGTSIPNNTWTKVQQTLEVGNPDLLNAATSITIPSWVATPLNGEVYFELTGRFSVSSWGNGTVVSVKPVALILPSTRLDYDNDGAVATFTCDASGNGYVDFAFNYPSAVTLQVMDQIEFQILQNSGGSLIALGLDVTLKIYEEG